MPADSGNFAPSSLKDDKGIFSGVDLTATITIPELFASDVAPTMPPLIELNNLSTISWSTHRDKVPVRRIGKSYVVGYTRGARTIAGSMVFVNFNSAALWSIIQHVLIPTDSATQTVMTDELPPFDLHLLAVNEHGDTAFMSIMGIDIVDEGAVLGVDETYTETTMQYVAKDINLMIPGVNLKQMISGNESLTPFSILNNILYKQMLYQFNLASAEIDTTFKDYKAAIYFDSHGNMRFNTNELEYYFGADDEKPIKEEPSTDPPVEHIPGDPIVGG